MRSLIQVSSFDFSDMPVSRSGCDNRSRITNQNDARLHQLEIIVVVIFDSVDNVQFVRCYELFAFCFCIFKLMHGVDTTFRIPCMKLPNENCRQL